MSNYVKNLRELQDARINLAILFLVALGVTIFHILFHEPWRDETQTYLVAIAPQTWSSFSDFMHRILQENHPPLPYLLMGFLSFITGAPYLTAIFGGAGYFIVLTGLYRYLLTSGGSRILSMILTLMTASTYVVAYEYGVIARSYGIGIGLIFWGLSFLEEKDGLSGRHFLAAAFCFSLAGSSNLMAAILAGSILLISSITRCKYIGSLNLLGGWLIFLPVVILHYIISFFGYGRGSISNVTEVIQRHFADLPRFFDFNWQLIQKVLAPMGFWQVPFDGIFAKLAAQLLLLAVASATGYALFFSNLRRRILSLIGAAVLSGLLLNVVYAIYLGSVRHHFHLIVIPLALLCHLLVKRGELPRIVRDPAVCFMSIYWLLGFYGVIYSMVNDAQHSFSQTKQVADRVAYGATIIPKRESVTTSLKYHRPDVKLLSSRFGPFTFMPWDKAGRPTPMLVDKYTKLACATGKPVYFVGSPFKNANLNQKKLGCISEVPLEKEKIRAGTQEYFGLHLADCDCWMTNERTASK